MGATRSVAGRTRPTNGGRGVRVRDPATAAEPAFLDWTGASQLANRLLFCWKNVRIMATVRRASPRAGAACSRARPLARGQAGPGERNQGITNERSSKKAGASNAQGSPRPAHNARAYRSRGCIVSGRGGNAVGALSLRATTRIAICASICGSTKGPDRADR